MPIDPQERINKVEQMKDPKGFAHGVKAITGWADREAQASRSKMPFSLKDEIFVIGCMYHNLGTAEEILSKLELEDFFNPFNREVFKIARTLTDAKTVVTSHNVVTEFARPYESDLTELPFEIPTFHELERRFRAENIIQEMILPEGGLEGAIARLKQDAAYRDIIARSQDAIIQASGRSTDPLDIVSAFDGLSVDLQRKTQSVIVWSEQAETEAQATYDALDRGDIIAIATGFPEVDDILYGGGFWPGDMVVVSGATSGGKTTFALNLAANAADAGVRSLYFTLEMKTFKVFSRIHSSRAKVPGYKIRPHMTELYGKAVRDKLRSSGDKVKTLPIGFIDSLKDLETMRRVCRYAVREHGVQYIFFDYMGLMQPNRRFRGSRYDRATQVSEGIKELAGELNIPAVALSQLRRKYKEEKSAQQTIEGNEVEPNLEMLKESGSIENDADTVIFLWGEKAKEGEQLAIRDIRGKIAKQRNGMLDRFELKFAPDIFTFRSMAQLAAEQEREASF